MKYNKKLLSLLTSGAMLITEFPNEMIIKIIYKLNYLSVLNLYVVSNKFKIIIDEYIYSIYQSFEKNNSELLNVVSDWNKAFNYTIFSKIYSDTIKRKKQALIIIRYIYKWVADELAAFPDFQESVPTDMVEATHIFLLQLFPNSDIPSKCIGSCVEQQYIFKSKRYWPISYRTIKNIIEKFVSEVLLNYMNININRIHIEGFEVFETFYFNNPQIYMYNKDFNNMSRYKIKINKYDTKLFNL